MNIWLNNLPNSAKMQGRFPKTTPAAPTEIALGTTQHWRHIGPMKINRNTPQQLIVENNPVWLAVILGVSTLIFVGVGLSKLSQDLWTGAAIIGAALVMGAIFNLAFVRRSQFIFDRPGNLVEMRRKSLVRYTKRSWELAHLERAIVQSSRSDDTTTYRAALVFTDGMDAGTHPITLVYSSGRGASRAAEAINNWLTLDSKAPSA